MDQAALDTADDHREVIGAPPEDRGIDESEGGLPVPRGHRQLPEPVRLDEVMYAVRCQDEHLSIQVHAAEIWYAHSLQPEGPCDDVGLGVADHLAFREGTSIDELLEVAVISRMPAAPLIDDIGPAVPDVPDG